MLCSSRSTLHSQQGTLYQLGHVSHDHTWSRWVTLQKIGVVWNSMRILVAGYEHLVWSQILLLHAYLHWLKCAVDVLHQSIALWVVGSLYFMCSSQRSRVRINHRFDGHIDCVYRPRDSIYSGIWPVLVGNFSDSVLASSSARCPHCSSEVSPQ